MQSSSKKIHKLSSILDLPTCIMVDILSRLPINSISDCSYVCKAWYDLLSDPYFATVYRKRPPYVSLLLFQSSKRDYFRRYFQLLELKWDYNSCQIDRTKLLKIPANPSKDPVQFLGCCNGLIWLSDGGPSTEQNHFYICNLILKEYVKLPQPNIEASDYKQVFGFGCHPTTAEYKVLRIIAKKVQDDKFKSEAEVFTLGVDHTWRNVGDAPFPGRGSFRKLIPLHGALHWLVEDNEEDVPDLIYSFDIKEEKLCSISTPIDKVKRIICNVLGVLRNCLCVFLHIYSLEKSDLVIWSLRRYGVVESWTKEIIIDRRRCLSDTFFYQPIATWGDGEILMHDGYNHPLLSYNPKEEKTKYYVYFERDLILNVIPFVTSCVSLKDVMKERHLEVMKMN